MLESEQGIIGCILVDNKSLFDVYHILNPDMFVDDFFKTCYNEMLVLFDNGKSINPVELSQRLENNRWDSDTIREILINCVASCPSSTLIKSYAETIIKSYKARSVKSILDHISLLPKDIDNSIGEVLTKLESLNTNVRNTSKSLREIVDEQEKLHFIERTDGNIKTGLYKLDDCIGGLQGGDIIVLGARPAVGKSAFCMQIANRLLENGGKVGYFNLEMQRKQVYERILSTESKIDLTRIIRAQNFLGDEEQIFKSANDRLRKKNMIVSVGTKSVREIKAESRHQKFDMIVIDYLQLIKPDRQYSSRVSEVGDISKAVKELAMELNVPIVLLSQLSRAVEQRDTKEPNMSDLRESGDIEQDASIILLMWNLSERDESFKGLKCEKNRMGTKIKECLKFDGSHMAFMERMEDFKTTLRHCQDIDKGFELDNDNDTPFS